MKKTTFAILVALVTMVLGACQTPETEPLGPGASAAADELVIPEGLGGDDVASHAVATERSRGALSGIVDGNVSVVLSSHHVEATLFGADAGPVELPVVVDRQRVEVGSFFPTLSLKIPEGLLEPGRAYRLADLPPDVTVQWTHWVAPPVWFEDDPLCALSEAYGEGVGADGSPVRLCALEMWLTETYVGSRADAEILITIDALDAYAGGSVSISVEFRGVMAATESSEHRLPCCCSIDGAFPVFHVDAVIGDDLSFDSFSIPTEHDVYMLPSCGWFDTVREVVSDPSCPADTL